jgi:hypothetical protein
MKRSVQIYIEGERIELFNDEEIQVNSSVQNVNDIDKVKTDFSQSFTVPASPRNNAIFQHFYQNDVNATLNYNIRRDAFIEIDTVLFRKGKIQLEKADIKNLATDSYTITFYGEVTGLKDQFGEDKLSMLDYSAYTHEYTGAEVLDRVSADLVTDFDVRYPLISSKRVWQYNEPSTPLDNIDTNTGRIEYTELFPALKVARIFDVIESTYGVTFQGSWLQSDKFQKLFLLLKNNTTFETVTPSVRPTITSVSSTGNVYTPSYFGFDLTEQVGYLNQFPVSTLPISLRVNILGSNANVNFWIDVYRNGALVNTVQANTGSSGGTFSVVVFQIPNSAITPNEKYYVELRAASSVTIQLEIQLLVTDVSTVPSYTEVSIAQCNDIVLINDVNLSTHMPDMKVADFVAGIMREFNLTLYPVSDNTYYLEPLEDWYSRGVEYDITEYTTTDEIEVKRLPLFKKIEFKYQKSESFMNNEFSRFFNRYYADLNSIYNYDGGDYTINPPFEEPLFNKFTGTSVQVGYCLKDSPEYSPYVPKAVLLYFNGMQNISSAPFKFGDGVNIVTIFNYALFGQDLQDSNGNRFTLCWGAETSSFYDTVIDNSLYNTYYAPYLQNLYNPKQRLISVKTVLPLSILSNLKLMDRLIIRDKRYIINDMKNNLVNGEVMLTLLQDFRPLRKKKIYNPSIDKTTVNVGVNIINGAVQAEIDVTGTGAISATPSIITEDSIVEIELPPLTGEIFEIISEQLDYIIDESGTDILANEEGESELIEIPVTYTFQNGDTEIDYIEISRA